MVSLRNGLAALALTSAALGAAPARSAGCDDSHESGVGCFQRWDIKGFYHAVGTTLTEKENNIATTLLPSASVTLGGDDATVPVGAKVIASFLYWSGARETPDDRVELRVPGLGFAEVIADKCYTDSDNRTGSISKQFYACRADITGFLNAGDAVYGQYDVSGVDSVILPGGQQCTTDEACFKAASQAAKKEITSCKDSQGNTICECNKTTQTCTFGQSTISHASYSLVFIYEHGEQTRSIFLYDGMEAFIAQTFDFDLANLKTPAKNGNAGTLSYYVVEGDDDNVVPSPLDPDNAKRDNPGEKVTLAWGTDISLDQPDELSSDLNPLWEDPFNGTAGAGVDIESYELDVPSSRTRAKVTVHTPNIASVTEYPGESCVAPDTQNNCLANHQCACKQQNPGTTTCAKYSCIDNYANDGIGVAVLILGFDVFAPTLVGASKDVLQSGTVDGDTFDHDENGDDQPNPGELVTFAMTATNEGSSIANSFKVVDALHPALQFAGWQGEAGTAFAIYSGHATSGSKTGKMPASVTNNVVTVTLEPLQIGETVKVYFDARLSLSYAWAAGGEKLTNQAQFEAEFIDPVPTDSDDLPGNNDATDIPVAVSDFDGDGVMDHLDNCPKIANVVEVGGVKTQPDLDQDGIGDACDDDDDGDNAPDATDPCPLDKTWQTSGQAACCEDGDGDGVFDGKEGDCKYSEISGWTAPYGDNCITIANPLEPVAGAAPAQPDHDRDDVGDACDDDDDGDGLDAAAEASNGSNPLDADSDDDGLKDGDEVTAGTLPTECDTDGDGLPDGLETGVQNQQAGNDTDKTVGCGDRGKAFIHDKDPQTTTNPTLSDTDGGGIEDGIEDQNKDGFRDADELDPNDPSDDAVIAGGSQLFHCSGGPSGRSSGGAALLVLALIAGCLFRRYRMASLLALVVVAAPVARAEDANYNPFRFAGNHKGIILTESAELEPPFDFTVFLGFDYEHEPLVLRSGVDSGVVTKKVVEARLGLDIGFAMAFTNWFELDLLLPMLAWQKGVDPVTNEALQSGGLGDIVITPRFAYWRRGGGSVGLLLSYVAPTGRLTGSKFTGEKGWGAFRPTIAFGVDSEVVDWALNLGATIRDISDAKVVQQGMEFNASTGLEFNLFKQQHFLAFDVWSITPFTEFFQDQNSTGLEIDAAYRLRIWRVYTTLGYGKGLTSGRGVANHRGFLQVAFASEILDRDGDGVEDDVDQCPDEREDMDRYRDEDGCPEPDNDGDGILDTSDECANEPEDFDQWKDGDGCPELDNDEDGILDPNDQCKNEPEDRDNYQDGDGCPELDNDQDGVLDPADKCPVDKEDVDQWQDGDGCPEPDNDNDKKLDADDKCPNDAENYNGYNDEDGCPDILFTCKEFIIDDKVYFKTGSAKIEPKSFKLLDAVASTILEHPEAEVTEVQGHTDMRGARKMNLKLSDKRAKSVAEYLTKKGVPAERLQGTGYGPDKPFEEGKSGPEYYDQNRRVQFIVLKLDPTKNEKCRQ